MINKGKDFSQYFVQLFVLLAKPEEAKGSDSGGDSDADVKQDRPATKTAKKSKGEFIVDCWIIVEVKGVTKQQSA